MVAPEVDLNQSLTDACAASRNGPVLLVSKEVGFTFPLAYGYLAGYLRAMGEKVEVLFRPHPDRYGTLVRTIMERRPLLVGFGSLYPELKDVRAIVAMLNEAGRDFPVVIGGQMVSPIPEFAVQITGADYGVIGEGEITLWKLAQAVRNGTDPVRVPGLVIRHGDRAILTGVGEYIEDLSRLPAIPYDLFPTDKWLNVGRWYAQFCPQDHWRFSDRVVNVHGGRGCPFSCNFCYHHSRPRYRPMAIAVGEARDVARRFSANMLYFSDETTLPNPSRVREMLGELASSGPPIEYSVSSRFDILDKIDDGLLLEMRRHGCRIMGLGVESGSDRILQVIGKRFSVDLIRKGLDRLRRVGILPTVSIMVGQYTETVDDVEQSIALMRESVRQNPRIQYAFTLATPFPGSELYRMIFDKGLLRDHREFYDKYVAGGQEFATVVNLSAMDDQTLAGAYKKLILAYAEEKARSRPRCVPGIERRVQVLAERHEDFVKWTLPAMEMESSWILHPVLRIVRAAESWVYECAQRALDSVKQSACKRIRGHG